MEEKINFIKHYQNSIEKSKNNLDRVLHCLKKLDNIRINVKDLQETGIGKTVNSLREMDGEVGDMASELIIKWKKLINTINEDEHKFEAPKPPPPREKHESKKSEKSSSSSSDSNKKSKSSSSSSSSSNHHHSSSSSHSSHSSSSKQHQTNHLSSTSSSNHNHHSSSSSSNNHNNSDHKSKEHKKSSESKSSSESKHHKSHHTSSSSHKTSSSHKRSSEDAESKENELKSKKMKSDHEKSDKKSNNSSNDAKESSSSSSNGTSSKSKKKDHKTPTKRKHSNDEEQEFDGANGMGFAEALAAFDMPSTSSKRQKSDQMADKIVTVKSSSSSSKSKSTSSSSSSSSHKKDKEKEKEKSSSSSSSSSSRPSTSKSTYTQPPKLLTQKPKLDLLPDIVNELPSDVSIPDYRPLPLNSAMKDYINSSSYGSSMQSRHNRAMDEGDLLTESFSSQKSRTRVFSGNSRARSDIPKLYEMCLRILTENLDYIECTGGVPFDILRPVLEKAKPEQLTNIEYYNPYLLEDSDILWKPHCQRKWKNRQPLEMESWRDMYDRCNREDEEKLSRLTQNIKQMQEKSSNCVQKTKMAFVDSVVKAPRGIARKQEQFGTSRKPIASPAARVEALKNIQPNLAVPGDVRLRVAAGLRDDAQQIVGRGGMQRVSLVKKAPMMAKILSKFKR